MNYRIIIVDDEPKIIQLIRQLGKWEELGIEIVDECHDGEAALESILRNKPDFVLSDIKMPVYDGIQLIEKVREHYLDTLFILLSGYRHFEYARSAIQLNVMDYLLKPIDEGQLNETLEKVCRRIDQLKQQKENHERVLKWEEQEDERQTRDMWQDIIYWQPGIFIPLQEMSLEECNEHYHTGFEPGCFQVICTVSNLNGMLETDDSLFSDKVRQFALSGFQGLGRVLYFATFRGHVLILNFKEEKKTEIRNAISALFYNIRDLNEIYGNFRLNIGCGGVKYTHQELAESFYEAGAAEWGRLVFLGSSIIEYSQIAGLEKFDLEKLVSPAEWQQILDCVKYLREEELGDLFAKIYQRAGLYNNGNPACMKHVFYQMEKELREAGIGEAKEESLGEDFFYAYLEAKNFQQIFRNLYQQLERKIAEEQKKLKEKLGKPLGEAVRYIKNNYMNQISQEEVAAAANVSTNYLSHLFKEEMKIGFNEYLTQIRIEESMRLLTETNLTVKQIAAKSGYLDEKYYSKLFKKQTGIKPTDYRKLYG